MKVTVVTWHPAEDESSVLGVLTKATKANVKKLLEKEFCQEPSECRIRIQPGTNIVEFSYNYDGEWDEWVDDGAYELTKVTVQ